MRTTTLAAMLTVVLAAGSWAAELTVPKQHPTIQAAIDAAQPGDTVRIDPGTYNEAITLKPNVSLEGAGREKVVVRRPGLEGPVLTVHGCGTVAIRGIAFEHTDLPKQFDELENHPGVVDVIDTAAEIADCEVRGGICSGILIQGTEIGTAVCTVRNVVARNNVRNGISAAGKSANVTVTGCTAEGNACGICYGRGAQGTTESSRCSANKWHGAMVDEGSSATLIDNDFSENADCGIFFCPSSTGTARGNRCERNKGSGIGIDANASPQIRENLLQDNVWCGIRFADGYRAEVKRNTRIRNGQLQGEEVFVLFDEGAYDDLETLAARLRKDKTKTAWADWQLQIFYEGITRYCRIMSAEQEKDYLEHMDAWGKLHPDSVTRLVSLAYAYNEFGWRERGGGWARNVKEEGWGGFEKYLERSLEFVAEAEKLPEKDPALYVIKARNGRGLGRWADDASMAAAVVHSVTGFGSSQTLNEQAFRQGVALEPTYYLLYAERAVELLPRWNGSTSEVLAFAEASAKATAAIEGEALYARIALCTLNWEGEDTFLNEYKFEWPRIRQGCRDVLKRYPDTNFWLNVFCHFACLYEDRKTAADLFAKIDGHVHGDAWTSQYEFTKWAEWAAGKGANPRKNPLEAAVRDGDVGRVQKLLAAGHDPNGIARSGKSMLQVAVDEEEYRIVQVLLDAGADVNRVAPEGAPAILRAARIEGDDTFLRLLLAHKANPNAADKRGWTPLLNVLANRETGKALLLLDNGADPNLAMNKWTPLHYAAEHGYSAVAMKLLEKGADPDALDANDYSPLCYAALAGNINLCRAMLEKDADPNISDKNGWTLLLEVVKRGNLDMVKLFVAKGGDINRVAKDGTGAFDAAAESGSLPMLEYLLGTNPDGLGAVANDKLTLLHRAAGQGHVDMVKFLLDKGLDPNARTEKGVTPLGAALENSHKDVADLLRARGATE